MFSLSSTFFFFFFNDTATTEIYTLSLHDALPISWMIASRALPGSGARPTGSWLALRQSRSEEHTSELQSLTNLVCRLLLEKKKKKKKKKQTKEKIYKTIKSINRNKTHNTHSNQSE